MGIFQPVGQKRLTNVAVVRFKKGGKRFEIACYRNKVQEWRTGVEKDLDEVLQSTTVFENVSKAKHSNHKDLQQVFGHTDEEKICLEILQKGELQISDKERNQELDQQFRDVVNIIVEKCINPQSNLPYTYGMIEKGLRNYGFSIDPKRSTKQQALEAIPILQKSFPIERAKMRVKITIPLDQKTYLHEILDQYQPIIEYDDIQNEQYIISCRAEPGIYRRMSNLISSELRGRGQMEILTFMVQGDDAIKGTQNQYNQSRVNQTAETFQNQLNISDDQNLEKHYLSQTNQNQHNSKQKTKSVDQQESVDKDNDKKQENKQQQKIDHQNQKAESTVVYQKGPINKIPEEFQKRKEMFLDIEQYQQDVKDDLLYRCFKILYFISFNASYNARSLLLLIGWTVELHQGKNSKFVEAIFYNPQDQLVGPFNKARAQAIRSSKN